MFATGRPRGFVGVEQSPRARLAAAKEWSHIKAQATHVRSAASHDDCTDSRAKRTNFTAYATGLDLSYQDGHEVAFDASSTIFNSPRCFKLFTF